MVRPSSTHPSTTCSACHYQRRELNVGTITETLGAAQAQGLWPSLIPAVGPFLSAVVAAGAIIVGVVQNRKLSEINARNADIAEMNATASVQQAETAALKLRIDLFDRRYAAYENFTEAVRNSLRDAIEYVDNPTNKRALWEASRSMAFLFGREVRECSDRMTQALNQVEAARMAIKAAQMSQTDSDTSDIVNAFMGGQMTINNGFGEMRELVRAYAGLDDIH